MHKTTLFNSLILLLSFIISSPSIAHGQMRDGILKTKMEAVLRRKSPPQVYIMDTAISVRVKSLPSIRSDYSQQMASVLESELINRDGRLKPEPNNPETIISCEITRLETAGKWEQRRSKERQNLGERQEYNEKKQKYETKSVYQDVEVTRRYQVVTGAISVSYQVKSAKSGFVLDAETFPINYAQEFLDGNGAPTSSDVENLLIRNAVNSIIPRLVPTVETVKVLLPKKDLKDISKFGEAGLWQKMVEGLEMMQPFKDQKKEAYRLYGIGLGYEAQAYQADDISVSRKFLDKSSALYNQAIEMNPEEKYFREPQTRIETAILQYKKIEDQRVAYAKAKALKEQEDLTKVNDHGSKDFRKIDNQQTNKPDKQPADKPMTNQDVINMASRGLDEPNLLAAIKQAASVDFDLRPDAILNLLQNKISNTVIARMRTRQAARKNVTGRTRTKKK